MMTTPVFIQLARHAAPPSFLFVKCGMADEPALITV